MADIDNIIQNNLGLIGAQLTKMHLLNNDEAYSEGLMALYNAATTYDTDNGTKFSTYATTCIYNALASYIRKQNTLINSQTVSYDTPLSDDGTLTFADVLVSDDTADTKYLSTCGVELINSCVDEILQSTQNAKAKAILTIWIESNYTAQQKHIAEQIGCAQTYVSKVIVHFRTDLKKRLRRIKLLEV